MQVASLEYGSLLSYTPRPSTSEMEQAKSVMYAIKNDGYIERPPVLMSEWIAKAVQQNMTRLPFASFFHHDTVLVPVPRSTLMRPNTLWMPERIATALVRRKIGGQVLACLARLSPLRKAAWSDPSDRPRPSEQYNTISVQGRVSSSPGEVVLVDDIITRGATMLGAANRVVEAFPN